MSAIEGFGINWQFNGDPKKVEAVATAVQNLVDKMADLANNINESKAAKDAAESVQDIGSAAKESGDRLEKMNRASTKAGKGLEKASSGAGKFLKMLGGTYAISRMVKMAVDSGVEMGRLSESIGSDVSALSAWSQAVAAAGEDAGAFRGTVANLSGALMDSVVNGGPMLGYLSKFGVAAMNADGSIRDTLDVMEDLSNSPIWQSMNKQMQFHVGRTLGIDDGTIRMMQDPEEFKKARAEQERIGVLTEEQVRRARDAKKAYNSLFTTLRIGSDTVTSTFLPAGTAILETADSIAKAIVSNDALLYGSVTGGAALLTGTMLPALKSVIGAMKWLTGAGALGGMSGGSAAASFLKKAALPVAIAAGGYYALQKNAEAIAERQNALNEQIGAVKTASDADAAHEENRDNMLRGLVSTNPLGAIDRYQKGEKAIERPIDDMIASMSPEEKHAYRTTENFDPALAKRLDRLGYGRTNGLSEYEIGRLLDLENRIIPNSGPMNKRFLDERESILSRAIPLPDAPQLPAPAPVPAPAPDAAARDMSQMVLPAAPDPAATRMNYQDLVRGLGIPSAAPAASMMPAASGGVSTNVNVGDINITVPQGADSAEISANIGNALMDEFSKMGSFISWQSETGLGA